MARVVRNSKFRHVFGQAAKKSDAYDNIRITKSGGDSTFCAVNPKFVAVITESAGGGAFLVLPLEKTGRVDRDVPLVSGHKSAVLDLAWCPHNDNLIASGSEDCTVKIWQIPDGGITEPLRDPTVDLVAHQRRVTQVLWHPSALNVLLSSGGDMKIFVWDVSTATILSTIECHPDLILSVSWNYNGSRIVTSCKDKQLRVINPRSGEVLQVGASHEGAKPTRAVYLRDGRIFSTGFSKRAERQYAVWDENNLGKALVMEELDSSNGILFPFYDEDTGLIFLCGKGDSAIRYFEYSPDPPYIHYLSSYTTTDPQRGIGSMPKRALNISSCEIARFYKLLNNGACEVISFTVPRKSELFQDDLYPDSAGVEHVITAEEWIAGQDADPKLISMRDLHSSSKTTSALPATTPTKPIDFLKTPLNPKPSIPSTNDKPNGSAQKPQTLATLPPVDKPKVDTSSSTTTTTTTNNNKNDNKQIETLVAQISTMQRHIDELERRVKVLESSKRETVIESDASHVNDDDLKF